MPREGIEDFRIVIAICCACVGEETSINQHISKMQKYDSWGQEMKVDY